MKRLHLIIAGALLAALLAIGCTAWANMPAYGPPSMTGKVGNALLWEMKRTDPGFRGYAFRMALAQRGDWYRWAADGPNSFDCSGLIAWAYARAGHPLPHSSYAQQDLTYSVSLSHAHPGDLLFYSGHVAMYAGTYNGTRYAVAAHRTGTQIDLAPMRYSGLIKVGRVP